MRSKDNLQDAAVMAEDFFRLFLNELYDWELTNANSIKKNYPGVDLIDEENRIVVQVSVTDSKYKIEQTFKQLCKQKKYKGYELYFMFISEDSSKLRATVFNGCPDFLIFNSMMNILDSQKLFSKIASETNLEKLLQLEDLIKNEIICVSPEEKRKALIFDRLKLSRMIDYVHVLEIPKKSADYCSANELQAQVEDFNPDAMLNLAFRYWEGNGIKRNYSKCYNLAYQSAMLGNVDACVLLGVLHYLGKGTVKSYSLAYGWWYFAANKNHIGAQLNLAGLYQDGKGVNQNIKEMLYWYNRADELSIASYNLGVYFDSVKDYDNAFKMYMKSSCKGCVLADFALAECYRLGQGTKVDMSMAEHYYLEASHKGHVYSLYNLSIMYREGDSGKVDVKKAFCFCKKAAKAGLTDAEYDLGLYYGKGIGVECDEILAWKWIEKAASKGHNGAKELLMKRDNSQSPD